MLSKNFNIDLDICSTSIEDTGFQLVSSDIGSYSLTITIYNGTNVQDLTSVHHALIFFSRPNNSVVEDNINISATPIDGKLTYSFINNSAITVAGDVVAEIKFYNADNSIIMTSSRFKFNVRSSIDSDGAAQSTSEYTTLVELIDEVETTIANAEEATDNANTAATNANQVSNDLKLVWKAPVANFSTISTTYPIPEAGWAVQTLDNGNVYRWSGSLWIYILKGNIIPTTNYVWIEEKTINTGSNSFTLTNSVGTGQKLIIYDKTYGVQWFETLHWTRSGQVVTLTETSLVETLTFQIINLG
jgi:hypothetical protein